LVKVKHIHRTALIIFGLFVFLVSGFIDEPRLIQGRPLPPKEGQTYRSNSSKTEVDFSENKFDHIDLVKRYSDLYNVDFRLVLAIIQQESRFNHELVSRKGAIGLMQLMPVTHMEVAEKLDLENLNLPEQNIRGGVYYFSELRNLFSCPNPEDAISLTLAAYNAGPGRIYDAQDLAAYMGEDPHSWQTIEKMLPLLSKRYYTLHRAVWGDGKPRSGYFGSWRQTVGYVESVLKVYDEYIHING
jgi:membrane-bound lytic murein transglycosylase MltF